MSKNGRTYDVVGGCKGANLLGHELLVENLLLEQLILKRVHCFRKALVLLAFLHQSLLHLLHGIFAFN